MADTTTTTSTSTGSDPSGNGNGGTVRRIDWRSAFPFVHLFRGFRLAIDPSKLLLALAAILILYTAGRLLDSMWPNHSRAMESEIARYESYAGDDFKAVRKSAADQRYDAIKAELSRAGKNPHEDDLDDLEDVAEDARDKEIEAANKAYNDLPGDQKNDEAAKRRDQRIQSAHAAYASAVRGYENLEGQGLFIHFLEYEVNQIDAAAQAALALDFAGPRGLLPSLVRLFFIGPKWAITQHPVFFTILFALLLLLMAIAGGAISRIAAVQVARDEKISLRQALRFSTGKVLSFVFAPVIPILIIVAIGLLLGLLSLPMSIGYIGGIWSVLVGALFVLALLAGLVMALTALGLIGGGHLMYPTIAVEGSDSFDAVSRSFSYLYARPWQLIFYSLVALVYGAITYLFVRLFLFLLLRLTHWAVGMFQWGQARDGSDLWNSIWPQPTDPFNMSYLINSEALNGGHTVGAGFIAFWVYLTLALLGAYAISLYYSSSTIIYYLMRKEVDATAIDEVYLEPSDDDFAEPAATAPAATTTTVATAPESAPPAAGENPPPATT